MQPFSIDRNGIGQLGTEDARERALARLEANPCEFAPYDHEACRLLLERLEAAARFKRTVSLAQFVRGITFKLRAADGTATPHVVDVAQLVTATDAAIIHDYARYLGAASFRDHGILLNALVVQPAQPGRPPEPPTAFYQWLSLVGKGIGPLANQAQRIENWAKLLSNVFAHYAQKA